MNNYLSKLSFPLMFLILFSCQFEGKDYKIEKVEWKTYYIDKTEYRDTIVETTQWVDTLVEYKVLSQTEDIVYSYDSKDRLQIKGSRYNFSIKNMNTKYSNKFKVNIKNDRGRYASCSSDVVSIGPLETYNFRLSNEVGYNSIPQSDSYTYEIIQYPQSVLTKTQEKRRIKYKTKQRIDKLIKRDTIVNNRFTDVDALVSKYRSIEEVYNKLKDEGFIVTDEADIKQPIENDICDVTNQQDSTVNVPSPKIKDEKIINKGEISVKKTKVDKFPFVEDNPIEEIRANYQVNLYPIVGGEPRNSKIASNYNPYVEDVFVLKLEKRNGGKDLNIDASKISWKYDSSIFKEYKTEDKSAIRLQVINKTNQKEQLTIRCLYDGRQIYVVQIGSITK